VRLGAHAPATELAPRPPPLIARSLANPPAHRTARDPTDHTRESRAGTKAWCRLILPAGPGSSETDAAAIPGDLRRRHHLRAKTIPDRTDHRQASPNLPRSRGQPWPIGCTSCERYPTRWRRAPFPEPIHDEHESTAPDLGAPRIRVGQRHAASSGQPRVTRTLSRESPRDRNNSGEARPKTRSPETTSYTKALTRPSQP